MSETAPNKENGMESPTLHIRARKPKILGIDGQNCCLTGHVSMSVTGQRIDTHCVPGVLSVWHTEHSVKRPKIKSPKHEEPSA